jgi:hypothetical protein
LKIELSTEVLVPKEGKRALKREKKKGNSRFEKYQEKTNRGECRVERELEQ